MQTVETYSQTSPFLIAFYLPQFHPIPENDEWWGIGFTEWTHVRAARPLFPGHQQPRVPTELGYYDLRDPKVLVAQAELAQAHGVRGFCFWHYWFGDGRRVLHQVVDDYIASSDPEMPFCLAWANESWTGVWYGAPNRTLITQQYLGIQDDLAHFEAILPALTDPRYITVNNKPLLMIFRPKKHPYLPNLLSAWRKEAQKCGFPDLYVVGEVHYGRDRDAWLPSKYGLDATVDFGFTRLPKFNTLEQAPTILDFTTGWQEIPHMHPLGGRSHPCIVPQWDNTPRSSKRGVVLSGATPALFTLQLERALDLVASQTDAPHLIFIRSWNEWGETNYLEPDSLHGRAYLEAIRLLLMGR